MRRLLRSIADIREGEGALALLLSAYYFALLLAYYLLRPARDSLFLTDLGPERLPLVFMLVALVVAPAATLYAQAARRSALARLLYGSTLAFAGGLLALRLLLWAQLPGAGYALYAGASAFGALAISQFWLLAGEVYDAAQARRLFAVLNTGAMLGAFAGGEVTGLLAGWLGLRSETLLLCAAGVLVATLPLLRWILAVAQSAPGGRQPGPPGADNRGAPATPGDVRSENGARKEETAGEGSSEPGLWRTIKGQPLLGFIVGLIALETMTSTVVDYQFKTVATEAFSDSEQLTAFLGSFYGRVSLVALAFQVLVLPPLLRRFGTGSALLIMPVSLLAGTLFFVGWPALWPATLLHGADQSFEHSADKVGRELLFLPLPEEVRRRVKVFVDAFADRAARGLAGALLLFFAVGLGWGVRALSAGVLALLAGWIAVALLAKRSYTRAFEEALRRGEIDAAKAWTRAAGTGQALGALRRGVEDADDLKILHALEALSGQEGERAREAARPLLSYPSKEVRRAAIRVLSAHPATNGAPSDEIEEHLLSGDPGIRRAAFRYRFRGGGEGAGAGKGALRAFMEDTDNPSLRTATAACVVRYGTEGQQACLGESAIEALIEHEDSGLRMALARVLAGAASAPVRQRLTRLAGDERAKVRRAAARGMGEAGDEAFVPVLIRLLADDAAHVEAWNALSRYGAGVLDALVDAFRDSETDETVRRRLPRVIGTIPGQRSVDLLLPRLQCADPTLRYNVTGALHRLHAQSPEELSFPEEATEEALRAEAKTYYRLAQALRWVKEDAGTHNFSSGPAPEGERTSRTLDDLLEKRRARSAERIFQLLGLRYAPQEAVRRAYEAFSGGHGRLRGLAVEWIQGVIGPGLRRLLRPIIDASSPRAQAEAGRRLFGIDTGDLDDALTLLITGPDPKLQRGALRHLPPGGMGGLSPRLQEAVREAARDPDRRVRAAAEEALQRFESGAVA